MQVAPKHDFSAKLRQSGLFGRVISYVQWQKAVRKAKETGQPPPLMPNIGLMSINLDLTTACNYRCTHCVDFDKLNTGINYVDLELFESLQQLVNDGLKSVILIGGGEPTMHRMFEQVVVFLKNRDIKIGIVTNGSRGDLLLRIAPTLKKGDWIRLSLDSGKNDTFTRMHLPVNKRVNLDEICSWIPKIRDANPEIQVGFSFIIVWDGAERTEGVGVIPNIDEIVLAAELARDSRFSYISYKPYLTRHADGAEVIDHEVMANISDTMKQIELAIAGAKRFESEDFKVLESTNLRVLLSGTWRDFTRQPKMCHMMAFRQVLSPLGVFHCPAKRGVENARVASGNAFTPSQKPDTLLSLPVMLEAFDASRECREITCLYNATNWWLENMIDAEAEPDMGSALPDHADYFL